MQCPKRLNWVGMNGENVMLNAVVVAIEVGAVMVVRVAVAVRQII